MAVIVDQKRLGGGSHSTVGTVTDIYGVLRLLFSRVGKPSAGGAIHYSFNDPRGMCPECGGLGKKVGVVSNDFLDLSKSLNEGAVQVLFFADLERQAYSASGFFDNDKKLSKFTKDEMELLLHGKDKKFKAKFGDRSINLRSAHRSRTEHQGAQGRAHRRRTDGAPRKCRGHWTRISQPQP
jgi:excinuclease UvrABC ATPase subunit